MAALIRFACPSCGKTHKALPDLAGKLCKCNKCGKRMPIPHPISESQFDEPPTVIHWSETSTPIPPRQTPPPRSTSLPDPFAFEAIQDEHEPEAQYSDHYEQPVRQHQRQNNMGSANRIVAGIGAGLLLLGMFLPMVNAPFGIWLSFVDLPWKATSVGLNAAANAEDTRDPFERRGVAERIAERSERPSGKSIGILLVAGIAILYPLCILSMIGIAFFQICGGKSRETLVMIGAISLLTTIFYAVVLLALSAQKDFGIIAAVTSPGLGWGVVLLGALALTGSGKIRPEVRE